MDAAELRRRARERLPFGLRLGLRRAPALLRWSLRRPENLPREPARVGPVVVARSSPLARQGTALEGPLQAGKEANVRRVVGCLDGLLIPAGATFSWHAELGPPLRARGFVPGPELHDGRLEAGGGGGACQVANLVFWLGVHGGLEVVERHRHGLDLFADHARSVPFGAGATVFWPHRDLRLRNPHGGPARLRLWVEDGEVHGALELVEPLSGRIELVERDARFLRDAAGVVHRENRLVRRWLDAEGRVLREEDLARHRARVCYPVAPELVVDEEEAGKERKAAAASAAPGGSP